MNIERTRAQRENGGAAFETDAVDEDDGRESTPRKQFTSTTSPPKKKTKQKRRRLSPAHVPVDPIFVLSFFFYLFLIVFFFFAFLHQFASNVSRFVEILPGDVEFSLPSFTEFFFLFFFGGSGVVLFLFLHGPQFVATTESVTADGSSFSGRRATGLDFLRNKTTKRTRCSPIKLGKTRYLTVKLGKNPVKLGKTR